MSENKDPPTVLRLKRKACSDPLEGLYIASKKSKHDESSEIFFKFAATINSENESIKDHIQAAIVKANSDNSSKWRDPKSEAISERTPANVRNKLRGKHKEESVKKRLDLLNTRRLIFAEDVPIEDVADEEILHKDSEAHRLFKLYDIIEESEEAKSQVTDEISSITLNGKPMICKKVDKYVYDVYISEDTIDKSFVEHAVSVRPCFPKDNSIELEDSDAEEDVYEDDDDSNDENNWRNDYPDESSHSEKESENESDEYGDDSYGADIREAMNHFNIDEDEDDDSHGKENAFHYSRLLKELKQDYEDSD